MNITTRPATPKDAESIERLEQEFARYLGAIGDTGPVWLSAESYLKDGFGEDAAFSGLIAESEGQAIGYLLYHPGYDVDRGGRVFYVFDLFVTEEARRQGAGRALMETLTDICRKANGHELLWGVFLKNKLARQFYEKLGATDLYEEEMTYMHWKVNP